MKKNYSYLFLIEIGSGGSLMAFFLCFSILRKLWLLIFDNGLYAYQDGKKTEAWQFNGIESRFIMQTSNLSISRELTDGITL